MMKIIDQTPSNTWIYTPLYRLFHCVVRISVLGIGQCMSQGKNYVIYNCILPMILGS